MKEKSVFDFRDYKPYLAYRLEMGKRGTQARLADALRCHSGYLTQVLRGNAHFSVEQGVEVNRFFAHSPGASDFFLLLLQRARAGTAALREYLDGKIATALEERLVLKKRLQVPGALRVEDESLIYGSWHYVAIHLAVMVPSLRDPRAIAAYLGLPVRRVRDALGTLVRVGLVREEGNSYVAGKTHAHLGADSPSIAKHHANWRLQALHSLDRARAEDLHYSSVVTVSEADAPRAREILVRAIEEVRRTIRPSADEALYAYCVDWFALVADSFTDRGPSVSRAP